MTMERTHAHPPLSGQDLAALGLTEVAYVKGIVVDGRTAYAIFAANGQPLGQAATRDVAFATVRQNDLDPVSAH